MKKLSVLLALLALFFVDLALAAGAVATSVVGTVQVQTGSASPRPVRQGDEFTQGDTLSTGATSSAVLKFDDGQVVALTANSRMTITAYQYNPATESGNVFLSLVTGGMRAITGLIGRRSPNQVAYRAATATIGIRGTDGTIATNGTDVVVTVTEGVMTLTMGDLTLTIAAGEAVFSRPGQTPIRGTISSVLSQLPPAFAAAINQSGALTGVVTAAGPGTPRQGGDQGQQGQQGSQSGQQGGQQGGQGGQGGGGGGNGNASGS
jgi:FecR protein